MPNMSPEDVWGQVVEALRAEIGEGAFTSYLEQARVREGRDGALGDAAAEGERGATGEKADN